eukprot:TRINITY_DN6342_c0_g1_i9.p1 TRINITY_DN6342_c0_g1~~TRINITY_DN6342_c0_g1_i9.p1  ORF type:complete len:220 (-),score=45.66 TRINITY_DN6342_c0_g1_i9:771-1430(-)
MQAVDLAFWGTRMVEDTSPYESKWGGKPIPLEGLPFLSPPSCSSCNTPLALISQLYSPVGEICRCFYVFGCNTELCTEKNWVVVRATLGENTASLRSPAEKPPCTVLNEPNTTGKTQNPEESDWGGVNTADWGASADGSWDVGSTWDAGYSQTLDLVPSPSTPTIEELLTLRDQRDGRCEKEQLVKENRRTKPEKVQEIHYTGINSLTFRVSSEQCPRV